MNAPEIISKQIAALGDWRGKTLADVRRVFHEADPDVTEELKWKGHPCWSHDGVICVATPLKGKLKLTFIHGADLPDPEKLFNNGFGGGMWRAMDFTEGDKVNERALKEIFRAAVAQNHGGLKAKTAKAASRTPSKTTRR
jgi:hypothetical protein